MTKVEMKEIYATMFAEYPEILNTADLQNMLGISRHLAYKLMADGYIPGVKIGNSYRIPKFNVISYMINEGCTQKNAD